eukprot:12703401-Alexandrium_andersonii.AAC.1
MLHATVGRCLKMLETARSCWSRLKLLEHTERSLYIENSDQGSDRRSNARSCWARLETAGSCLKLLPDVAGSRWKMHGAAGRCLKLLEAA